MVVPCCYPIDADPRYGDGDDDLDPADRGFERPPKQDHERAEIIDGWTQNPSATNFAFRFIASGRRHMGK